MLVLNVTQVIGCESGKIKHDSNKYIRKINIGVINLVGEANGGGFVRIVGRELYPHLPHSAYIGAFSRY